ncbi:hypothetical protein D3C87_1159070 [compost metagenome]
MVSSRLADGATMAALLPPSSRMVRLNRPAQAMPTSRPMRVEPVALISRTAGCCTSCAPSVRPPGSTTHRPACWGAASSNTRSSSACAASAHSGVFSDGFQTTPLPQTSASAAFHAHTATGKLNAEITPHSPNGCQVSRIACAGRSEAIVSPCSWRESPTAKSQMSIISCTSPSPSWRILPDSSATSRPSAVLCVRSASPKRRTTSPRAGAGVSAQVVCAACARAMRASASATVQAGRWPKISPSTGERSASASPAPCESSQGWRRPMACQHAATSCAFMRASPVVGDGCNAGRTGWPGSDRAAWLPAARSRTGAARPSPRGPAPCRYQPPW